MAEFLQGEIAERFLADSPLGSLPGEGAEGPARPFMLTGSWCDVWLSMRMCMTR
jgi:hypothetical protein